MSAGDVLDGFFSQSSMAFTQPTNNPNAHPNMTASTAPWERKDAHPPQPQQLQLQRPHTPSNNASAEATTVASTSNSSHGGDNRSYRRDASSTVRSRNTTPVNNNTNTTNNGMGAAPGMASHQSHVMRTQPSSFMPHSSSLISAVALPPPQPQPPLRSAEMDGLAAHASPNGGFLLTDVHLQHLASALGECKVMAAHQHQLAQTAATTLPAAAVLQHVAAHLEEDVKRLMQLRSALLTAAVAAPARNGAFPPLHDGRHEGLLPQTAPMASALGTKPPPESGAAPPVYEQSIWCPPENRPQRTGGDANGAVANPAVSVGMAVEDLFHRGETATTGDAGGGRGHPNQSANAALSHNHPNPSHHPNGRGGRHGMDLHNPTSHPPTPEDAGSRSSPSFLAFVEFKRKRVRKYECDLDISPGQFVMVDGDRGKDCGLLVQTIRTNPDGTNDVVCMDGTHINPEKIKLEKGRVLGIASNEEIDYLHNTIERAERVALETCKKVCDEMGITIQLQDCEYQFDREKISFYFNSEHSVDFRPLVRELYRMFHVRIWMENTNPNVKNAMPTHESASGGNYGGNSNNNNDEMPGSSDGAGSGHFNYNHYNNKHGGGGMGAGNHGGKDNGMSGRGGGGAGRGGGRGRKNKNRS